MKIKSKTNAELLNEQKTLLVQISRLKSENARLKKIKHQLLKLTKVVEQNPITILITDHEKKIEYVNPYFTTLTGYKEKEVLGKTPGILSSGVHDEEFYKKMWKTLNSGKIWSGEFLNKKKSGELYWESAVIGPVINSNGKITNFVATKIDITEQKKTEETLKESEEKFRTLAEYSPNMIFINQGGKVVYANKLCEEITGYSKEEFYSPEFDFKVLIDPADLQLLIQNFQLHQRGAEIPPYEYGIITKAGKRIDTIINTKLISYGGKTAILGIVTDITQRKNAEKKLQDTEQKLRDIIEHTTNLFYSHTPEHVLTYVSPQSEYFLGYKPEEAMVRWTEFATDNPINEIGYQYTQKAIDTGERQPPYELELRTKDDRNIWVEVHEAPIVKNGKTVAIVGALRDITERKKAEEALKESEAKWRSITENSPDIIALFDKEARLRFINRTAHGLKQEDVIGSYAFDIIPEEYREGARKCFYHVLETGMPDTYTTFYYLNEEEKAYYQVMLGPVFRDGKIVGVVSSSRDITSQKIAEKKLENSHEQLRALAERLQLIREEERAAVAREIHDDLGQVLTALKMDVSWLRKKPAMDKDELLMKTDKMLELINSSILTVKRLSSELRPGILDDLGLFSAIEWQAEEFQKRTNIKCILNIPEDAGNIGDNVSVAAFRIFQETLTNVIRHSNAFKVEVNINCTPEALIMEIEDNGIGIGKEQLNSPKSLGIIGMRERVNILGGELVVSGVEGKGTWVKVKIPLSEEVRQE
jgi:PAS domain S-box-containing protein